MVIRQQASDVIAYGRITTTITKAKETQRHVDRIITLAKENTLASKRKILSKLLDTTTSTKEELLTKLADIAKKNETRNGGYTRVLKLGKRRGDNTEEAILELV
jgi:large subunit ribosomal protein L17